ENDILIGLITNASVLGQVAAKWDGSLFRTKESNTIADWCVRHYRKYGKAPGKSVLSHFRRWASKHRNTSDVDLVERRMQHLDSVYRWRRSPNAQLLIDMAGEHFREVRLE